MLYGKVVLTILLTAAVAIVQAAPDGPTKTLIARDGEYKSINPVGLSLRSLDVPVPSFEKRLTNAQRLVRGLPLRKPRRVKPRVAPSSCPTTSNTGTIQVTGAGTGAVMGYLSATANSYGEYGLTSDASAAMRISFGTSSCASSAVYPELDITAQNGLTTYPLTGFITGFSNTDNNLYSGSFNYAYFGGVATETPAGSPAITEPNSFSAASGVSRAVESAVWSWSTSTNALTPQWINTDGSFPTNYLVYVPSSVAFALLGDVTAFSSNFVNVQVVTFTFVPSSSLP